MDAVSVILFGMGMFLAGFVWDQLDVHTPVDLGDAPETVTPKKGDKQR